MILPLLRPAIITVIVVTSVAVYNDFVNPLYFLPGTDNATVQLTLFNFQSQFNTRWNLLFADVLLITIPPLRDVHLLPAPDRVGHDGRRGARADRAMSAPTRDEGGPQVLRTVDVRVTLRTDSPTACSPRLPSRCVCRGWCSRSRTGAVQEGPEVQAAPAPSFADGAWSSGVVESADQIAVPDPGPELRSREARCLRARVRTQAGWSAWSDALRVEAGLLDAADWVARPITLPDDPGAVHQSRRHCCGGRSRSTRCRRLPGST